jgi:hypothetical protein
MERRKGKKKVGRKVETEREREILGPGFFNMKIFYVIYKCESKKIDFCHQG